MSPPPSLPDSPRQSTPDSPRPPQPFAEPSMPRKVPYRWAITSRAWNKMMHALHTARERGYTSDPRRRAPDLTAIPSTGHSARHCAHLRPRGYGTLGLRKARRPLYLPNARLQPRYERRRAQRFDRPRPARRLHGQLHAHPVLLRVTDVPGVPDDLSATSSTCSCSGCTISGEAGRLAIPGDSTARGVPGSPTANYTHIQCCCVTDVPGVPGDL